MAKLPQPIVANGGIGIKLKKGSVGGEVSISSDGVRVGAGIGILDVEYNLKDGTGKVGWGFGLYEMQVSRDGCTYIKDFYISGIYTHTEYQPITDGECKREKKDKDKRRRRKEDNDEIENFEDFPRLELDPDAYPPDKKVLALYQSVCYEEVLAYGLEGFPLYARGRKIKTYTIPTIWDPNIWDDIFKREIIGNKYQYTDLIDWEMLATWHYQSSLLIDDYWISSPFEGGARYGTEEDLFIYAQGEEYAQTITDVSSLSLRDIGASHLPSITFSNYANIASFVNGYDLNPQNEQVIWRKNNHRIKKKIIGINLYDGNGPIDRPFLRLPPPTKLNKECCDKLDKRLKRLEAVLDTQLLLDNNGVKVPRNLFIPGGRGDIKVDNYADYLATIIRIQAQSGIFPFSIEKKDINLVRAGNQSQTYYLPTATEAIKAVLENTIDNETKNDAILNLSVRIGIMVSKVIAKTTFIEKTVQAIADFLGYPRREKVARERIEVDPTLGARKQVGFRGFGPAPRNTNRKIEKQIELIRKKLEDGDKSLESALEDFLQPDDVAVRYEDFDDESGAPDLMELIDKGR